MEKPAVSAAAFSAVRKTRHAKKSTLTDAASAQLEADRAREEVYGRLRYALLNAIPHEHTAILSIFGEARSIPSREHVDSSIEYVRIPRNSGDEIYVVLSGVTGQGIAQSAAAAAQIKYKCRHVTNIILVGIAAGQPNLDDQEKDVRLGDIVVSNRIVQYDHIKLTDDKKEWRGKNLAPADSRLMMTVDKLRAYQNFTQSAAKTKPWANYIAKGVADVVSATRPPQSEDPSTGNRNYSTGLEFVRSDDEPYVHVGTVGSASTLLKNATFRDQLNEEHGTIAYEMEGAGLAIAAASSGIDYLMVRGICDYGDATKNDKWQTYASVCAAAFARSVLEAL